MEKVNVFVIYSKEDEKKFLDKLETHLKGLRTINFWYDGKILAGEDTSTEIQRQLRAAHIIIYLVSPNSLVADYLNNYELPIARSRHENEDAILIPVIIKYCSWEDSLNKYEILMKDKTGRILPVNQWSDPDECWYQISLKIRQIIPIVKRWEIAMAENSSEGFLDYLENNENAFFRKKATKKKNELFEAEYKKAENNLQELVKFATKCKRDTTYSSKVERKIADLKILEEQNAWTKIKNHPKISLIENFLLQYPQSSYKEEAEKLKEAQKLKEQNAWEIAHSSANIHALSIFVHEYPESVYRKDAEALIKQVIATQSEATDWNKAETINTIPSYLEYLTAHKNGKHEQEADANIKRLYELEPQTWEEIKLRAIYENKPANKIKLYQTFIHNYPAGLFKKEAYYLIAKIKSDNSSFIELFVFRLRLMWLNFIGPSKPIIARLSIPLMVILSLSIVGVLFFVFSEKHRSGVDSKNFIYIKGGEFTMKQEKKETEASSDKVMVKDFRLSKYEFTYGDLAKIDGKKLKRNKNYPLDTITTMLSISKIIKRLNNQNQDFDHTYDLPTEEEWEYAAKGGIHYSNTKYSGSDEPDLVAWHSGNSGNRTHPVGKLEANVLGLYDMSGNVCELTKDIYGPYSNDQHVGWISRGASCIEHIYSKKSTFSLNFRFVLDTVEGEEKNKEQYKKNGFRLVLRKKE